MMDIADMLKSGEDQSTEFKESWGESALRTLVAVANTNGGTMLIGVNDDAEVIGWPSNQRELQNITETIVSKTRIHPSLKVLSHGIRAVLQITVTRANVPVAYRGRYYKRVGNTTREIPPADLGTFFMSRLGTTWDALPCEAGLEEIDTVTVSRFAGMARPRLPHIEATDMPESTLVNLDLVRDGKLVNAAILLFGKTPQRYFPMANIHVGRFRDTDIVIDDKLLKGNLFSQVDQVMQVFRQYLQVRLEVVRHGKRSKRIDSVEREDIWEYPLEALREGLVNALIHRDYPEHPGDIEVRVRDEAIIIRNPGGLPEGMTVEELKTLGHRSIPRNPLLAQVFYYAGLMEKWGTGTTRMIELCKERDLLEPDFKSEEHSFSVTLAKDMLSEEHLHQMGLNERQIEAAMWIKEHGRITNNEYQHLFSVKKRQASEDLKALVDKGILEKVGTTGRGTHYKLKDQLATPETGKTKQKDQRGTKGAKGAPKGH